MKRTLTVVSVLFFLFGAAWADLTVHIQSPFRNNPTSADYVPHVLGGAGGDYTPSYGPTSRTIMTEEGDHWYVYTWSGKTLADFQEWMKFNFKFCPNTSDVNYNNNSCVDWDAGGEKEFPIGGFFGTDSEIWLYTDATTGKYTKSFMAPGAKVVWFKSPWGNKALPQMYFGADSVLMRFVPSENTKCGWFYGAVTPAMIAANPAQTAYFTRYKAPWLSVPADTNLSIDLSAALQANDTIYVDGTEAAPVPSATITSIGTCFDDTRVLHIYHPWRNNTSYRDSAFYITIGNNILNQPTPLSSEGEYRFWRHYSFDDTLVGSPKWSSQMADFQILRGSNEWPQHPYFQQGSQMKALELFPSGIYETWFYASTSLGSVDLQFYPPEPKVVRLLSPWDDMSPSMLVLDQDDTVKMGPLPLDRKKDTCGWYEGTYYKHAKDWGVFFKQTFGMDYYNAEGVQGAGIPDGNPVRLDSMMALHDTVWVYPYPVSTSGPAFSNTYPGRLGRCPELKISALVLDWAGESYADSIDVDFGGIYGGNDYTTVRNYDQNGQLTDLKTCGGLALGMVQDTLVNGVPARVDSSVFPWSICSAGHEIEKWFVPQVVAHDAAGKEYTNATCRDIDLSLDEEGFWLADFTNEDDCNDTINPGFYPIDDFQYLDDAKTVKNPKFDWNVSGCRHNYSFSMKISAQFQYIPGQYFEFRGDDDVWVYIDNRLVVDIGGCHSPVEGAVNLDTLGLIEGKEYPFQIFFSERNAVGSNFKMRTSINLQTEKTFFPVHIPRTDTTIEYQLLQILVEESLGCDISKTGKVDTVAAQSAFLLKSLTGSLPEGGVSLNPGVNYGGITISEDMAGFVIDTNMIVKTRSLSPGTYVLECYLSSDPTQSTEIYFTVPEWPKPSIVFVDSTGAFIPGDTVSMELGTLAFVPYKVRVAVVYGDMVCGDCFSMLGLHTSDSLSFLDMNSSPIRIIETDSMGFATFYVMGTDAVVNGSFSVGSEYVQNVLVWRNINLEKPKVPIATKAEMYDRNGDGIADSLLVLFNEPFDGRFPDHTKWMFGDSAWHITPDWASVVSHVASEQTLVEVSDGFTADVFTGLEKDKYHGTFRYHFRYYDEEQGDTISLDTMVQFIDDKIGAIIKSAVVTIKSDNVTMLSVFLSEGTDPTGIDMASAFNYRIWRAGMENSNLLSMSTYDKSSNGLRYDLYFYTDETHPAPVVGDSVRLAMGVLPDLSGNTPHINNPWVRIIGGQRLTLDATEVVKISPSKVLTPQNGSSGENAIKPYLVPMEWSMEQVVAQYGMLGHVLGYDLQELGITARDTVPLEDIRIEWEVYYFTNLGQFVNSNKGSVSCSDALFKGDCTKNPGKIFLSWDGRSKRGRIAGTGAYVSKLSWKVRLGKEKVGTKDDTRTMGIIRGK